MHASTPCTDKSRALPRSGHIIPNNVCTVTRRPGAGCVVRLVYYTCCTHTLAYTKKANVGKRVCVCVCIMTCARERAYARIHTRRACINYAVPYDWLVRMCVVVCASRTESRRSSDQRRRPGYNAHQQHTVHLNVPHVFIYKLYILWGALSQRTPSRIAHTHILAMHSRAASHMFRIQTITTKHTRTQRDENSKSVAQPGITSARAGCTS